MSQEDSAIHGLLSNGQLRFFSSYRAEQLSFVSASVSAWKECGSKVVLDKILFYFYCHKIWKLSIRFDNDTKSCWSFFESISNLGCALFNYMDSYHPHLPEAKPPERKSLGLGWFNCWEAQLFPRGEAKHQKAANIYKSGLKTIICLVYSVYIYSVCIYSA